MNHGVLCWSSGCESWCVKLRQWFWIVVCYSEQVVVKHGELCCEKWLWIMMRYPYAEPSGWESWRALLRSVVVNCDVLCLEKWLWIMMWYRYAEPSGWESWCFMPNQWLWIIVIYAEPVVVNHSVLWWVSGCESWIVMLCQRLWIMVCYAEPVVVNHGGLCWASGC